MKKFFMIFFSILCLFYVFLAVTSPIVAVSFVSFLLAVMALFLALFFKFGKI